MHAACQDSASRTVTSRGDYKPVPTGYRARITGVLGRGQGRSWPRASRRNERRNRRDISRGITRAGVNYGRRSIPKYMRPCRRHGFRDRAGKSTGKFIGHPRGCLKNKGSTVLEFPWVLLSGETFVGFVRGWIVGSGQTLMVVKFPLLGIKKNWNALCLYLLRVSPTISIILGYQIPTLEASIVLLEARRPQCQKSVSRKSICKHYEVSIIFKNVIYVFLFMQKGLGCSGQKIWWKYQTK